MQLGCDQLRDGRGIIHLCQLARGFAMEPFPALPVNLATLDGRFDAKLACQNCAQLLEPPFKPRDIAARYVESHAKTRDTFIERIDIMQSLDECTPAR